MSLESSAVVDDSSLPVQIIKRKFNIPTFHAKTCPDIELCVSQDWGTLQLSPPGQNSFLLVSYSEQVYLITAV